MNPPSSLTREISPPLVRNTSRSSTTQAIHRNDCSPKSRPSLAAIEAGQARIRDHLSYFASHLQRAARPSVLDTPRLSIPDLQSLYQRNENSRGRHFVVHQHDHPISGVHYDLRLQISKDSSMSFAIPYGLPGNPNSTRPNRMAVETRVHCLWNHLIESASHITGSLLIWDTGEYEVLQRHEKPPETEDEQSGSSDKDHTTVTDSEKLFTSFQRRHIRLRLHGTRLPKGYTISLRLPSANNHDGKKPPRKRRRRTAPDTVKIIEPETTDSDPDENRRERTSSSSEPLGTGVEAADAAAASDNEEDETIRANNAYPGAHNTIGSVHQRYWFLTLDRQRSGFVKAHTGPHRGRWVSLGLESEKNDPVEASGFETFFVRGREYERSIITGRLAIDVMDDEGVKKYAGRKMWRPIME